MVNRTRRGDPVRFLLTYLLGPAFFFCLVSVSILKKCRFIFSPLSNLCRAVTNSQDPPSQGRDGKTTERWQNEKGRRRTKREPNENKKKAVDDYGQIFASSNRHFPWAFSAAAFNLRRAPCAQTRQAFYFARLKSACL